ncbi:unnamed protein product [Xylocopa violacea]|uniref:E3 SUMO-protein ligase RanBP2 n=1 Tax=Xylocopa violacea TaxID=135666 RepID=A0ABP1NTF8_XYLVO
MFRSKKDVDRHVKDIFIKLKSSEEKNLRCYNIAKLYYQVGDYESAKKYVSNYLEIRDKSAAAHKLLGQAFEALGQKVGAFTHYKISLELEPKQDDLLLKVCELLSDMAVNIDVNKIKYWAERADKKFPHHPIVFELKEKILTLDKPNGNDDDLEKLITSELSVRQTDVHLQVKLLKHYVGNHRLEDAYNQADGIEATYSHRNNIVWYQSLSELLVKCKESKQSDWTFWIFYISVLERYAALCLKEQGTIVKKSIIDATQAVFNFDQSLSEFKSKNFSNNPAFIEHMLLHMWGQLHFHLACLVLRKTKAGEDSWSEAGRLCGPLLLTALHVAPIDPTTIWTMHLKDKLKNQVHIWYREGSYRCSQAGHVLQNYARDNTKKLLDKIDKFCTSSWRERLYQRLFVGRLYQDGKVTSYFANTSVSNPPLRLCSYNELKRFDEISEEVWPDSLHYQVWLGLRARPYGSQNKDDEPHPNRTSRVFCELQFSVYNLHQAAPDSLSRLDIDAFLNAAIFCASSVIEEQQFGGLSNPDKLHILPADLTNTLCTVAQEQWWSYAYKVYTMDKQKPLDDDLGDLRLELQRGLEVIRCLGNHGLHPTLLVHLARMFHYRADTLRESDHESSDIPDLEARSEMYWSAAIPLLERLQNNQVIRITNSKFFNFQGKDMSNAELAKALEEGKLLLAQRFVRSKQYEKAINALQALKCPEASFQQGQMYEKLADEIVNSIPKENLTSEMRSQHIIMLSKARECFYLTLDRLRSPGTDPKHPLNSELSTHITDIENKLKRIDLDLSRGDLSRNECDGMSDESYSSAHSAVDQAVTNTALPTGLSASVNTLSTPQKNAHRTPKQSSTPYKPQHQDTLDLSRNRSEARPSPERLDAQIRSINQIIHSKDSMIQSITEQNKTILELNKTVMEKVEKLAKEVAELRKEIQKQRTQTVNVNPNLEEDLCILSEDDYNDLNYNANQSGAASSISGSIFQSSHRHPYSQFVYPSTTFQGYYPGMSFSDPNAQGIPSLYPPNIYSMPVLYPNIRSKMPENILQQGLFVPPTNQSLQIPLQKVETSRSETIIKDAPVNKVPPVNVAITTSDTLPTTAPIVQPTLSVTIPPHFRQGSTSTPITTEQSVPHCYQISMPSQATIPTTVNLPPLSNTLTTTPANISILETQKQDTAICSTGSPNSSDHEHDPIPDFVPVIPLPAEVKVTTGEEGQEMLFCARAKLYRFVENEWKERGIGNVKLLKNEEGKVRLVMRREQVFKVCANHYLAPDMELTAKSNNEKAWFWVAHDFADGELKLEKFCIKFKTVDEGISFKEHFDKAKASLAQSPEKPVEATDRTLAKTSITSNSVKKQEKTKSETKPIEQTLFVSGPTVQKQSTEVITTTETVTPDVSKTTAATTIIGGFSFTSNPIVQKVTTIEPAKVPPKTEISPFAGFTFNKTTTNTGSFTSTTQKGVTTVTTSPASQFTFSFAKTTTPLQSAVTTVQTTVSNHNVSILSSQPISTTTVANKNVQQVQQCTNLAASIVVGVQDADKSATQTEYEEVIFNEKINLQYYNNDTKQWENRGTGQMKILWNSKSNKIRLFMIDENSSKICYNYNVLAKTLFSFKNGSNTNVNWNIQYGSDNKTGMFAATFKMSSQASQFYNTITSNQQKMVKDCVTAENLKRPEAQNTQSNKTQGSLFEMFKPPAGSWECNACYTRNGASDAKCIACETPRSSASSKSSISSTVASTQVPLSQLFKPSAGSWECSSCYTGNDASDAKYIACETSRPSASTKLSASTTVTSNQIPLSQMFKPPIGSWKCTCCEIVNAAKSNYCVACDTPKDPSLPPKPKTDGFQISTSSSTVTPTFSFGIPQDAPKSAGFSFRLPTSNDVSTDSKSASSITTEIDTKVDTSGAKFVFGMQQRSSTPTNKDSTFVFGTPGKSFGFNLVPKSSPTKSGGDENSEEEVEENDDIHFMPLIPLPDKIEVKTGEEDEEVLYSHRAKLFRFDKNEWKERGLGDIKLLRHKETGKLRLVMRREQVLKLCLNHFVLPNMELKPKDEKTWMWNAADYSDGEIEHTFFACRFKTPDIANSFKDIIDESRKKLPPVEKTTTETKVAETSAEVSSAQDIEVLYEMKVTPEEKQAALKLQLPENFYAYTQKPDCPGCRGCKESSVPLFQDGESEKSMSVLKSPAEDRNPSIAASMIQFPSKSIGLSTTTNEVTTVQAMPVSTTTNTVSTIFKSGLCNTSAAQFTSSLSTVSNMSFGNTDSTISNDNKTGFSFVIPQIPSSINEKQKSAADKENVLTSESLKICSPITSQAQVASTTPFSFVTPTSTTPTASIFGVPKLDNTGKNIFGGTTKKDSTGLLKPSSLSLSNSESTLSNTFNTQPKTVFGPAASIFGSATLKSSSENVTTSSSSFVTTTTTAGPDASAKPSDSASSNTSTPFSFNLFHDERTTASSFTTSNSTTTNAFEKISSTTSEDQKESDIPFLPTTEVSFSTLAAKSSQPVFQLDPNFSFAGAGTAVFGSKSNATNKSVQETKEASAEKKNENEEEEGDQNVNDQDHDPHFEPVIPLPDIVEVHTGEEDEEKVFCERAKLYRYDGVDREWKERGVGEMKILHHAEYNTYRLLLRRDQVYKVVCNFLLTPDINFSKLSTSDRAWIWAGMNYAEEQPCLEQLAVKFKNTNVASNFKNIVDKIQQTLTESRKKDTEESPIVEEPEDDQNEEVDEEETEEVGEVVAEEIDEVEDEEEEYDDDDDQNSIIFEKRATLLTSTNNENQWDPVALGNLIIYYDSNIFGERIILKADKTDEVVSNTIISMNTKMEVHGKECIWTAIDYALTPHTKRTLCAVFSSVQVAQEMYGHFLIGVEYACHSDISEPSHED